MPFKCSCGSEEFWTHYDEEITSFVDGAGNNFDYGDTHDVRQTHNYPFYCCECNKEYSSIPPEDPETEWVKQKERACINLAARRCPICEASYITLHGQPTFGMGGLFLEFSCSVCDSSWVVKYKPDNIDVDSYPSDLVPTDIKNPPAVALDPNQEFIKGK